MASTVGVVDAEVCGLGSGGASAKASLRTSSSYLVCQYASDTTGSLMNAHTVRHINVCTILFPI